MTRSPLPIDPLLSEIVGRLADAQSLVFKSTPGSGKTTRVPPAILEAAWLAPGKQVLVLEPRRIAAKFSALRVCEETGTKPGELIGWQFRFENTCTPKTRLRFLTEGMFVRLLLSDPTLKDVGAVVLDEFHERHLQTDLAAAWARHLQKTTRPDLRVLVLSATIDTAAIAKFFGGCPTMDLELPMHPVKIEHLPSPPARRLEDLVAEQTLAALRTQPEGDCLVFLPGMGEILRCAEKLRGNDRLLILPLHGDLTREEQDRAMRPVAGKRRVILATNIAETSITIEGLRIVIDSGFHRQASADPFTGLTVLRTRPISRASATQRAGRAGRTGPGLCVRLYTRHDHDTRAPFDKPEIERADLAQTILEMKALDANLHFFEAPPALALNGACRLLWRLHATESAALDSPITKLGRRMAEIPLHPRLARVMLEAERLGVCASAGHLCARISEGDLETADAREALHRPPQGTTKRLFERIQNLFPDKDRGKEIDLARAVLAGFPDRVARKRPNSNELVFSFGGSGSAEVPGNTFVVLESRESVGAGGARAKSTLGAVIPIEESWLFDIGVEERKDVVWDRGREIVLAVDRLVYDELVLSESPGANPDPEQVSRVLIQQGLAIPDAAALPLGELTARVQAKLGREDIEPWLARLQLLGLAEPDLRRALMKLIGTKISLKELRNLEVTEAQHLALEQDIASRLDAEIPAFFNLPGRKRAPIHFKLGETPVLESRIQDFFGLKKTPSLAHGKIALKLSLLAPNKRPVQVTSDIEGFWIRTYPEVRNQLMRRYPKHRWPENPLDLYKE